MKKLYTILAAILLTATTFAQTPEKMSYQAIVRDSGDNLVTSQPVGMRISILQGATAVYVETQTPTTNVNGLVTLEIGGSSATVVSGTFITIDWSTGTYFVKTETDPTGSTTYTITGTSQLMSVPYALYAKTVAEKTYTIGLWPELGGYVFRVSADGRHGLVAETINQSLSNNWYTAQDIISNPVNHSPNGQKFMDWRLPTKHELNEMYVKKVEIGGFANDFYWSSSEYDSLTAWAKYFINGGPVGRDKTDMYAVRAVRTF